MPFDNVVWRRHLTTPFANAIWQRRLTTLFDSAVWLLRTPTFFRFCCQFSVFLVADTQLYKMSIHWSDHWSIRWSVHWSISPSVGPSRFNWKYKKRTFMILQLFLWVSAWQEQGWVRLGVGCPCPLIRNDIVTPRHMFHGNSCKGAMVLTNPIRHKYPLCRTPLPGCCPANHHQQSHTYKGGYRYRWPHLTLWRLIKSLLGHFYSRSTQLYKPLCRLVSQLVPPSPLGFLVFTGNLTVPAQMIGLALITAPAHLHAT